MGLPRAKVVERLGRADDPSVISLSIAARLNLPMRFSDAALAQAKKAKPIKLGERKDLRELPARHHRRPGRARLRRCGVWAAPDGRKDNPGGWEIVVAIADVAFYVRPGDALDKDARERGNSVYFPGPGHPHAAGGAFQRPVLAPPGTRNVRASPPSCGSITTATFSTNVFRRALMRSRARLTYERVQAAHEGCPGRGDCPPLSTRSSHPLFAAYEVLAAARRQRGTIELDLPERRILFDPENREVVGITRRERLASHMLIEEFMILANVAAASAVERAAVPALYRVHDKPDPLKLEALADYLERIGVPWSRTAKKPGDFTALLERITDPIFTRNRRRLRAALPGASRLQPQRTSVISAWRCSATRTSPRPSAVTAILPSIAPSSACSVSVPANRMRVPPRTTCPNSALTCRAPSAGPWKGKRSATDRFTSIFLASRVGAEFTGKITGCAALRPLRRS